MISFLLSALLSWPATAQAAQFNLALPGNIDTSVTPSPAGFIVNFYQFAMVLSGVLAFGVILYGSVLYSVSRGNPTKQGDAIDRLTQAFFGILLLVGAYAGLFVLNPGLTRLELPRLTKIEQVATQEQVQDFLGGAQLPVFSAPLGTNNAVLQPGGGRRCEPPVRSNNYCASSMLRQYGCNFPNEAAANQLSAICKYESGGGNDPAVWSRSDRCQPGGESVSWGIFQINLSTKNRTLNGKPCSQAFDKPWSLSSPNCRVINPTLYNECKAIATNIQFNLKFGCQLYNDNGFKPWTCTARSCGFMSGPKCKI